MKYLLILLVLAVLIWRWRSAHRPPPPQKPRSGATPGPATLLACTLCGVHVSDADSVRGQRGVYCCRAHLQRAEP